MSNEKIVSKICPICEKPHKRRTNCCMKCDNKRRKLAKVVSSKYEVKTIAISRILWLKNKYRSDDIFELLLRKPFLVWDNSEKSERLKLKREIREEQRGDEYRNESYKKWDAVIPLYIHDLFKNNKDKELLTISGDKLNPNVHYICKKCNEEQCVKFNDLRINKGHNCIANISTGEVIVGEYLNGLVGNIKTQFDTLKCTNPITNRVLPYDFEFKYNNKKYIIEVQGDQHTKFIEYFHGTLENYYYQVRKDEYKRKFALSKGYELLYIYYNEFINDEYKTKIENLIKE